MSNFSFPMNGLHCIEARIRYYLNIVLGFGEVVEVLGPRGIEKQCTWEVMSWNGIWRVTKATQTLFGSGDDESLIEERLPSLVGLTIDRIDHENPGADLRVGFTGGTNLEILRLSETDSAWSIKGPAGWYPADVRGAIQSDEEERLSAHSEECFKRWSGKVPSGDKKRRCKLCAFYRHLHGSYYFWDFGVCTNAQSEYDGKVVNIGSVCDFFSRSLMSVKSETEK